jgi:hypothetical protein
MSTTILTKRDMEMLALGRKFERQDIVNALEESAKKQMKRNAEYSLNVGFILELLKELKTSE